MQSAISIAKLCFLTREDKLFTIFFKFAGFVFAEARLGAAWPERADSGFVPMQLFSTSST
jgi:hypothetical protein